MITQLNVFMENKRGRLYEICHLLGRAGINIRGFSVADMADFGIFRLIVANPEQAKKVLKDAGFTVSESKVVIVGVPDRPGGLAEVLAILASENINVEYLYMVAETKVAFSLDDNEKGIEILRKAGIPVLEEEEISRL